MFGGIRIGRLAGIPFLINPTWFLVFALFVFTIATQELPQMIIGEAEWVYWVCAVTVAVLFFGSLVAHELGHSLVSRRFGIPVLSITLYLFGGVAQIGKEVRRAREELLIALAGPAVSLALGGLFWGVGDLIFAWRPLAGVVLQLAGLLNIVVLLFNLVPGFPLDGGRVLRAAIWGLRGDYLEATKVASVSGQMIGALFIAGGIFLIFTQSDLGAFWMVLIGWFLISMARTSYSQAHVQDALQRHKASDVMESLIEVSALLTADELYSGYLRTTGKQFYLALMYDRPAGVVTAHMVERIPRSVWGITPLALLMRPIESIPVVRADQSCQEALLGMEQARSEWLQVTEHGHPVGIVTRAAVLSLLYPGRQL